MKEREGGRKGRRRKGQREERRKHERKQRRKGRKETYFLTKENIIINCYLLFLFVDPS
jgi:hypothetical protein